MEFAGIECHWVYAIGQIENEEENEGMLKAMEACHSDMAETQEAEREEAVEVMCMLEFLAQGDCTVREVAPQERLEPNLRF